MRKSRKILRKRKKSVPKRKYTKRSPRWKRAVERAKNHVANRALAATKIAKANKLHAFIFSFEPSGMMYYPNVDIEAGDPVTLIAQDDNPHDPFAIQVHTVDGQFGWFPRKLGDPVRQLLHRALKAGINYRARISRIHTGFGAAMPTISLEIKL